MKTSKGHYALGDGRWIIASKQGIYNSSVCLGSQMLTSDNPTNVVAMMETTSMID